ncbi:MAG: FKBP-type peptidyl-prolyl cis-trans isomerase [Candidatus Rokuibacteriota bacterium]
MRISDLRALALLPALAWALVAAAPAAPAAAQEMTEEQKTLYALGLAIGQNLGGFGLTAAELETVKAGITDFTLKQKPKVDLPTYMPKIQELQRTRATAVAAAEKKTGDAFRTKAAGEKNSTKLPSGIVVTTLKPGSGPSPTAKDKVKVHYHGTLTDGTVFDSSVQRGEPATLPLEGVIKCWTEGVATMKVGGKSRIVCPSDAAYGDRGAPPRIKPGATLVFEVELLEIVK